MDLFLLLEYEEGVLYGSVCVYVCVICTYCVWMGVIKVYVHKDHTHGLQYSIVIQTWINTLEQKQYIRILPEYIIVNYYVQYV